MRAAVISLVVIALAGCTTPRPDRRVPSGGTSAAELVVEPTGLEDSAWPSSHFRVRGADIDPSELLLVDGELSDYYLARIDDRDLPKTLLERVIGASVWNDGAELVLVPRAPLVRNQTVSVAAPGYGLIGSRYVSAEAPPLLERFWPPPESIGGSDHAVYCGNSKLEPYPPFAALEPGARTALVRPGVDARGSLAASCLSLELVQPLSESQFVVPPIELGGAELDPAPLSSAPRAPLSEPACAPNQVRFGPACAEVEDDRLLIQSTSSPALWVIDQKPFVVEANARFVVGGFSPASERVVPVSLYDLLGNALAFEVSVTTLPAESHVVLNEVLANPLGPEPAQEWIEVVNDGTLPVDLDGFELADSGGALVLPPFLLAPGEIAVIASEDFEENDGLDVSPVSRILRVPSLAKNGLSNSGERLELRRPDASIASVFPALPKPKSGVSVARRYPSALDDDPRSFGWHADPGASPGAPNVLP